MRRGVIGRYLVWLGLLCLAPALHGAPERAALAAWQLSTLDPSLSPAVLVSGRHDEQFLPVDPSQIRLPGSAAYTHWLKFGLELPESAAYRPQTWVLRLPRVPIDSIEVYLPGQLRAQTARFFRPANGEEYLLNSFAFELPGNLAGEAVVYAAVRTREPVILRAEGLELRQFHAEERTLGMLFSAVYTAIGVLAMIGLAMFLALRERAYLYFVLLTGSFLAYLLAMNGHLYALPGGRLFAWWGGLGTALLAYLGAAFTVGFFQQFAEVARNLPRLQRLLDRLRWGLLALAALCLLNIQALAGPLQRYAPWLFVLVSVLLVLLAGLVALRGQRMARAFGLIWTIVTAGLILRGAVGAGWMPATPASLYGFQVLLALAAFLFSLGLADRVMEFRKQRDRARLQKEQTDASLQMEQGRRQFAEALDESLRSAPGGDIEWITFNRLLTALRPLLPQQTSGVVAAGYHGLDLMFTEPPEARERYSRLLASRGGTIKGICRSRKPVQARFEEKLEGEDPAVAASGGQFAVVPLPVGRPGWAAVLVERAPWEEFEANELRLAIEFGKIAVEAADDAHVKADLRRKAEVDPLTGSLNRRAGDAMLTQLIRRAISDRQPLSVLFVDLDHFKQVNDRHGHAVGDECLRALADTIRLGLEEQDVLARYGGEEFLVVLPGRTPDQARQIGERFRREVAELRLDSESGPLKLTVSVGVAGRLPTEDRPEPLVERADRALYTAKRHGRNQVQVAPAYGQQHGSDQPGDSLIL